MGAEANGDKETSDWVPSGLVVRNVAFAPAEKAPARVPSKQPSMKKAPSKERSANKARPKEPVAKKPRSKAPAAKKARAKETREVAELRRELAAANQRVEAAERRARRAEDAVTRYRRSMLARRSGPPVARPGMQPSPAPVQGPAPNGNSIGAELNEISFEGLRKLGLSVNQAARFIGQRDQRGGLRSLDDLDSIAGLSAEVRAKLKRADGL